MIVPPHVTLSDLTVTHENGRPQVFARLRPRNVRDRLVALLEQLVLILSGIDRVQPHERGDVDGDGLGLECILTARKRLDSLANERPLRVAKTLGVRIV